MGFTVSPPNPYAAEVGVELRACRTCRRGAGVCLKRDQPGHLRQPLQKNPVRRSKGGGGFAIPVTAAQAQGMPTTLSEHVRPSRNSLPHHVLVFMKESLLRLLTRR